MSKRRRPGKLERLASKARGFQPKTASFIPRQPDAEKAALLTPVSSKESPELAIITAESL